MSYLEYVHETQKLVDVERLARATESTNDLKQIIGLMTEKGVWQQSLNNESVQNNSFSLLASTLADNPYIRVFQSGEIAHIIAANLPIPYQEQGVEATWFEGVIAENKQRIKILSLEFKALEKLSLFLDQLDVLSTFSPLTLNCLGVQFADKISYFLVEVVYEDFYSPLYTSSKKQDIKTPLQPKSAGKKAHLSVGSYSIKNEVPVKSKAEMVYQLSYIAFVMQMYFGKVVGFCNFDWLFISNKGDIKILLPTYSLILTAKTLEDLTISLRQIQGDTRWCHQPQWFTWEKAKLNPPSLTNVLEYSLFVVIYFVVFGQLPFGKDNPQLSIIDLERVENALKDSPFAKLDSSKSLHITHNLLLLIKPIEEGKESSNNPILEILMAIESLLPNTAHISDIKFLFSTVEDQETFLDGDGLQAKAILPANLSIIKENNKKSGRVYQIMFNDMQLMELILPVNPSVQTKLKYFFSETAWLEMSLTPAFTPVSAKFMSGQSRHHIKEMVYSDFPEDYRILNFRATISRWVDFLASVEKKSAGESATHGGGTQGLELINEYTYKSLFEMASGNDDRLTIVEALSQGHRLLAFFKDIPKVFKAVKGIEAFEKDKELYRCRYLDFFGNRIECIVRGSAPDLGIGVVITSINPVQILDCVAYSSRVILWLT